MSWSGVRVGSTEPVSENSGKTASVAAVRGCRPQHVDGDVRGCASTSPLAHVIAARASRIESARLIVWIVPSQAHAALLARPERLRRGARSTRQGPPSTRRQGRGEGGEGACAVPPCRSGRSTRWQESDLMRSSSSSPPSARAQAAKDTDVRDALVAPAGRTARCRGRRRARSSKERPIGRSARARHHLRPEHASLRRDALTKDLRDGALTRVTDESAEIEWPDVSGTPPPANRAGRRRVPSCALGRNSSAVEPPWTTP